MWDGAGLTDNVVPSPAPEEHAHTPVAVTTNGLVGGGPIDRVREATEVGFVVEEEALVKADGGAFVTI